MEKLFDRLRPTPPMKGPPLPKGLGVRWPEKATLLQRHRFPQAPLLHEGPVPGGYFWALAEANDLPLAPSYAPWVMIEITLEELLESGSRVWLGNAQSPGVWQEIFSSADLPHFKTHYRSDYEAGTDYKVVQPYMPEFYVLPSSVQPKWRLSLNEQRKLASLKRMYEAR